jgi:hypothetical protein
MIARISQMYNTLLIRDDRLVPVLSSISRRSGLEEP